MKNTALILACVLFAIVTIMCSDTFAQRSVNSAQEAAKAAQESLKNQRNRSSSQIDWLNNVINTVNMNDPADKDVASRNNKAIEESKGR